MILRKLENFEHDVLAAVEYYVQFDVKLGLKFAGSVKEAISLLEIYPEGRPVLFDKHGVKMRRARINGFPYALYFVYNKIENVLYLYGVMHERKDPRMVRHILKTRKHLI
jgi:hypothetical protein